MSDAQCSNGRAGTALGRVACDPECNPAAARRVPLLAALSGCLRRRDVQRINRDIERMAYWPTGPLSQATGPQFRPFHNVACLRLREDVQ